MGSKKGLQKYKNIWSAKNNVTWTTKRSEKKVSRDSSWHVPEKNNFYFYFLFFIWEDREDNKFNNTTKLIKNFTIFKIIICNLCTIKMMLIKIVLIIIIMCHFNNCEKKNN